MPDRLIVPDSIDDIFNALYERGWTDGLPIIPPTPERVRRMLSAVRGEPATVIAKVPTAQGEATLETIAVNAVMAGCLPEFMPVLVAAVRAMCRPEFNLASIQGTGDPTTPGLLLNGPIRTRLNVNCADNAAGPGRRANATIGRAIRLILQNIGGGTPGIGDKSIMGQPAKYTFCVGENEENSPWEPFHVEHGFRAEDSSVTVVAVQFTQFISPGVRNAEQALRNVVAGMTVAGHNNVAYGGCPITLLFPLAHAEMLAAQGFSKRRVKEFVYEHARFPVSHLPKGEKIWSYEPHVINDEVLVVRRPEDVLIFVAGGYGYSVLYLGGWHCRPATQRIDDSPAHESGGRPATRQECQPQ